MTKHTWIAAVVLGSALAGLAVCQDPPGTSKEYKALQYPLPPSFGT